MPGGWFIDCQPGSRPQGLATLSRTRRIALFAAGLYETPRCGSHSTTPHTNWHIQPSLFQLTFDLFKSLPTNYNSSIFIKKYTPFYGPYIVWIDPWPNCTLTLSIGSYRPKELILCFVLIRNFHHTNITLLGHKHHVYNEGNYVIKFYFFLLLMKIIGNLFKSDYHSIFEEHVWINIVLDKKILESYSKQRKFFYINCGIFPTFSFKKF